MWPGGVVVLAEVLDKEAGLGQDPELLAVDTLVPEAATEALHEPAFPRTGRNNIDRFDVLVRQPALGNLTTHANPLPLKGRLCERLN